MAVLVAAKNPRQAAAGAEELQFAAASGAEEGDAKAEVHSEGVAVRVRIDKLRDELRGPQKSGVRGTARFLLPPAVRRAVGSGRPIEAPPLQEPRGPDREVRPPNLRPAVNSPSSSERRGPSS